MERGRESKRFQEGGRVSTNREGVGETRMFGTREGRGKWVLREQSVEGKCYFREKGKVKGGK